LSDSCQRRRVPLFSGVCSCSGAGDVSLGCCRVWLAIADGGGDFRGFTEKPAHLKLWDANTSCVLPCLLWLGMSDLRLCNARLYSFLFT
jgi:hypothetical protein